MGSSYCDIDDIEPAGPGGAVRFVRRKLDARDHPRAEGLTFVTVGSPRETP